MNLYLNILSKIMIFFSLILALSMKSFLSIWMFMEINLVSYLLWQFSINDPLPMIKYFLIQGLFSSLMLLSFLLLTLMKTNWAISLILMSLIFSKLGTPPIYMWFINFCSTSKFENLFMVATLQKIIPLTLIFNFNFSISFLWLLLISITTLIGIHQSIQTKTLLAFSSMFNMTWVFLSINNLSLIMIFLFTYSIILAMFIFLISKKTQIILFSDIFMTKMEKKYVFLILIIMMSMMGVPPFTGFLAKILLIESFMTSSNSNLIILIILMSTNMFMIFAYFRIVFLTLTLSNNTFLIKTNNLNFHIPVLIILNIFPIVMFL